VSKILLLSQYFPPESGAPQQRLFSLAKHLHSYGVICRVLTCHPHYPLMKLYAGYDNKIFISEEKEGIKIYRVPVFIPKKKSFLFRLLNYFSFCFQSVRYAGRLPEKTYDYVLCESPPLFLGLSALFLKRKFKSKLIFNVSDLWPESIIKLGITKNPILLWPLWKLESLLYKKSFLVTGQTQGICNNIQKRFPTVKTYWLPNGTEPEKWKKIHLNKSECRKKFQLSDKDFIIGYAGVIGLAQGLETVLECAKILSEDSFTFVLAGDGPVLSSLKGLTEEFKIKNVVFTGHLTPEQMPEFLKCLDVALVPLKKNDLFLGAIPSKIFENLAMKIPVLMAVDGEAREIFVDRENAVFFAEPENAADWAEKIKFIKQHPDEVKIKTENGYKLVSEKFNRKQIAQNFYQYLISCSD
jgi:glycosyltransferase involved in cell wall biosynthesis